MTDSTTLTGLGAGMMSDDTRCPKCGAGLSSLAHPGKWACGSWPEAPVTRGFEQSNVCRISELQQERDALREMLLSSYFFQNPNLVLRGQEWESLEQWNDDGIKAEVRRIVQEKRN